MKKILIAAVGMAVVFAVAPAAHAGFIDGTGKFVPGFSSQYPQVASASQPTVVADVQYPQNYISPLVGNTRIYDFIKAINVEDVQAFLAMVKRAGIRY